MSNEEFDKKLIDELSESNVGIAEPEIYKINPWCSPFKLITWGLILTTFTMNFFYLQYILPVIGIVLLYLGSRSLKNSNHSFKIFNRLTIINLFWRLAVLGVNTTKLNQNKILFYIIYSVSTLLIIAILTALRGGIKSLYKKSNRKYKKDILLFLIIFEIVFGISAAVFFEEIQVLALPIMIVYIILIICITKIPNQLREIGFELVSSPVKANGKLIVTLYLIAAAVMVLVCSFITNFPRDHSEPYAKAEFSEQKQILRDSGYNGKSLQYLTDAESALLGGSHDINESYDDISYYKYGKYVFPESKDSMSCESTVINMYNEDAYFILYFEWNDDAVIWQDSFNYNISDLDDTLELLGGNLFFEKDGQTFSAPINNLIAENKEVTSFIGSSNYKYIFGDVSFPLGSQNRCGYILAKAKYRTYTNGCSILNYYHAQTFLNYPYTDLTEKTFAMFDSNTRQFYTNFSIDKPNWKAND